MAVEDHRRIELLETWLCALAPRRELVTRMAIRSCLPELRFDTRYDRQCFARVATLIKELNLRGDALNDARADAQEAEAGLLEAVRGNH